MANEPTAPLQSILAHSTGGGVLVAMFSSFILIWLVTFWKNENKNFKILLLSSILISYTTIVFTSSRSGLLAIFLSVLSSIIFSKRYRLLFILLFFVILFFSIPNEKIENTLKKPLYSQNIEPRLLQYKEGIRFFKENPVFGIGLMQFRDRFKNLRGNYPDLPHYFFLNIEYLHNTYIALLAETGIIGFLLFYIFLILKIIEGIKKYLRGITGFQNCFVLFVIFWFLLDSIFNAHLYVVPIGIFLWIGIGLSENDNLKNSLTEKV
ncbi:MAG: O-antigen ligase family protein [Brevinematia bacterium]